MLILTQTLTQSVATAQLVQLSAALALERVPVVVDVSPLQQFDSAALAVLLELRRRAQALGKSMRLQGLPPRLAALARLYGVADVLGIASGISVEPVAVASPPVK